MADLVIAPYLPLSESASVGGWVLVPFCGVGQSELLPSALQRPATRLIEAYSAGTAGTALSAIAVPDGGAVGSNFERRQMSLLGRALLAGVLGGNPSMAVAEEEEEPNAGWRMATAENAVLYGHPLADGDSYAVELGVLARINAIRHVPGDDPLPRIDPPLELARPLFAAFDEELASGTYLALDSDDPPARRLFRALDWYRIALSNAEAVTIDVGVGAARSGLEVLTDAGEETKLLVRRYGELVREPDTPVATYPKVFWAKGPVQLTPDEWWMTRLCELRNAIVHGQEIPAQLWVHNGQHQLNHIHDRLIAALRIAVAGRVRDPLLRLAQSERTWARVGHEAVEMLRRAKEPPGASHE